MNSKVINHIRLISYAISAFFVVSCQDPKDIGLNLQDQSDILNSELIDTLSVNTSTVLLDDISTSTAQILLTGAYDDVHFGDVKAETFFQILLSTENVDFGSNPVCDSIKLFLDYNQYYYGDTSETQVLEVFKLTDLMDDSSYTSSSSLNVDPTPIGTTDAGFVARPTTGDSIIEIDLSTAYGDEIIAAGNTTNDLFTQTIRGLSIKPEVGNFDGCVMGFLASSDSKVILYYTNDTESSSYTLNINSSSKRFNSISSDRSATAISSLSSKGDAVSTSSSSNQGYFQAGTGLVTKLSFPTLSNLTDSLGDVAINRAEIEIYPVDGSINGDHDEAPLFLTMIETDNTNLMLENSDGSFKVIPNDFYTVNGAGIQEFNYDEDCGCYKLRLTQYFQDLIFGNKDNNGVLLIPTINSTRVTRCLFYDNDNLVNPGKALKLNLYYTKLGN